MLKTINPQHLLIEQRSKNQEKYIKEYLEFCDTEYLTNRIKSVLSENLSFGTGELIDREKLMEEMSPKIIQTGKETLYNALKKLIPHQISTFSTILPKDLRRLSNQAITFPIPLPEAMGCAKKCLFPSGYATALKFLYPNDEERIPIRQYFLQTISKELLTEIENKLLSETEFSPIEYCMREPLIYIYKRYGGTEDIGIDRSIIKEKYYAHQKKNYEHLLDGWEEKVKDSKKTDQLYEKIMGMTLLIKQYTFFFLKNTPTHIQRTPKKGMKKEYEIIFQKRDYDSIVAQQLPPDIEEIYHNLRDQRRNIKNLILQEILQQRAKQNLAGRVKRIIEQTIQKKF
ncbi:MAG: hypothetical protein LBI53_07685 [Candidatus Peribacteria bacterium]|jgi:hypothetical protein|nr:hypothetical protein [Candidatus Peribacteria bacterium]